MSGFLYYLPNKTRGISPRDVRDAGLGYALEGQSITPCEVQRGPSEKLPGGVVVCCDRSTEPARVGLYPAKQSWRCVPGTEAWCGWYTDAAPTPEALIRGDALDGHWVELGDGNDWLVPVARALTDQDGELRYTVALPTSIGVDDAGNFTAGRVVKRYKPLWDAAAWWVEAIASALDSLDGDGQDQSDTAQVHLGYDDIARHALVVLGANYRVGGAEMAALGLFDTQNVRGVLDAAVDGPAMTRIKKKMAPATSSSEGG